jgi:glycogen debranching enzyme
VERRAESLLDRVTPLFTEHLADAGIGSISEIFDAAPPALPHGAIAQAWSVAECLRMLVMLRRAAPGVYDAWEHRISKLLAQPVSGDTAGVCRATLALEPVTKHGKKQGEVR